VIPVQTIVPAALAAIVRKAPLTNEKVGFAWRTAVGAAVAGATDVLLDGTTLRVCARDRAWQREIERSAATIRTRLEDLLGPGVVRYLDVTVAAAAEPRPPAAAPRRATGPAAAAPALKNLPSAGGSDNARRRR
jgi:hypothetical protein